MTAAERCAGLRLLIVAADIPWPANSGGRVDIWRRLCALVEAGCSVMLVCWQDEGRDTPEQQTRARDELRSVCEDVVTYTIRHDIRSVLRRFAAMGSRPSHAAARWTSADRSELLARARAFRPDAVLADGLFASSVATWLADLLRQPLLYRAHNIEHRYMAEQYRLARGLRARLGIGLNRMGLQRFEFGVWRRADAVLDISVDDLAHWQRLGMHHGRWLPPIADESAMAQARSPAVPEWDVLYFGNLHTPNNVAALNWLIDEVRPRLSRELRFAVAGSRPTAEVRRRLSHAGISLVSDPPRMADVLARARVLVNPAQAGSGVNLKSVEMLFTDAGLVSTPVGVMGLPDAVRSCFEVAADASGFAAGIERALGQSVGRQQREAARCWFRSAQVAARLCEAVSACRPQRSAP
ncbi:MAG: glycosyltransferase [Burkholderiales bacterium]|nr:glycosyltransferase [Burkholderiales bacterium]